MRSLPVGEVEIAFLDEGPRDGRPVVAVHGFPDGPWTFDHLAAALVDAGFRVIRPWLRGHGPSTAPPRRVAPLPDLVDDVEGLATALDLDRPALVGHDWGAVIGWVSASRPDPPWSAVAALAIPPLPVQARAALDPVQALHRSGYMWWMQVPGVERLLPRIADRLYARWSPGWDPPEGHMARVRDLLAHPATARAAVAPYRWILPAVLTGRYPADRRAVPAIPVRYLHGADDTCFPASAAERARRVLPTGSVEVVHGAGHFLHLERPEVVTPILLDFLGDSRRWTAQS
ncbi:alpha/beta fold hydrolase [Euzebya sp.]|uniref:alpha/beta fold hydrolase n=1 Tax=Euzebya sp. TaxID=1971409 RepID=UPI003513ABE0